MRPMCTNVRSALVCLTAAMTLAAGFPHMACACVTGREMAANPTASHRCCCGQSCCSAPKNPVTFFKVAVGDDCCPHCKDSVKQNSPTNISAVGCIQVLVYAALPATCNEQPNSFVSHFTSTMLIGEAAEQIDSPEVGVRSRWQVH